MKAPACSYASVWSLVTIVVLVSISCPAAWSQQNTQQTIMVKASIAGAGFVEKWARAYSEQAGNARVVVFGTSNQLAFEALLDKQAALALILGRISSKEKSLAAEKGIEPAGKLVGRSGPAIITHPRNPVDALTMNQVRSLFTGKYTNWKEVGGPDQPVRVILKPARRSDVTKFFKRDILWWAPFTSKAKLVPSFRTTIRLCSKATDIPLGLVPYPLLASTDARKGVKVLALKKCDDCPAVMPSPKAFADLSYPAAGIPLYLYWDAKTATAQVNKFVEYCRKRGDVKEASK